MLLELIIMMMILSHNNFELNSIVRYRSNVLIKNSQSYCKSVKILEQLQKSPYVMRRKKND